MIGIAGLVIAAAIGVDYGWQQTDDGQLEYIIQISPDQLDSLREGEDIQSFLPPEAEKVTCFRVQIGTGSLPHQTVLTPSGPIEAIPATGYEDPSRAPQLRRPQQMNIADRSQGQWGNTNPQFYANQPTNQPAASDPYHYARPDTSNPQFSPLTSDPLQNRQASLPTTTQSPTNTGFNTTTNNQQQQRWPATNNTATGTGTTLPNLRGTDQEQPWLPLLLTGVALFLSLGGNAYLGWIAAEFYTRYRDTVERMRAERRY